MRPTTFPLAAAAVGALLLSAACGAPGTRAPSAEAPASAPSAAQGPAATSPMRPTAEAPRAAATPVARPARASADAFTVWLVRNGTLFPTTRTGAPTVATSRRALNALIAGPSANEAAAGVTSAMSSSTTFEIAISGGVATLDLPTAFYAGGRDVARLRQAQVVYTLTQYPTVSRVGFQKDGEPAGWPVGRADYLDRLAPLVVTAPSIAQRVGSPVRVTGVAAVYESTVQVRLLDAAGRQLARTFTTAACLRDCLGRYGDYAVSLPYRSAVAQCGTAEVFAESPKDGRPLHTVRIPVTLRATV